MKTDELRNQISTLRIHLDHMYDWWKQASSMIDNLDEALFDIEDALNENRLWYNKEECKAALHGVKKAVSRINIMIDSPPRLASHCGEDDIAAVGFYQSKLMNF